MQIKIIRNLLLIDLLMLILLSCSRPAVPSGSSSGTKAAIAGAPCLVYRTRSDYSVNVPVILSDDRSTIVSFPDIKDIWFNGKLSYPTPLAENYLLDNRGIGPMVAFLSYTYEEYSRLSATPPASELMKHIIDKDPLTVMYQCGLRSQYQNPEQELNVIITTGKLETFKKLK
ncbi:MAG: hypothetical protein NTU98_12180 [Bacteroidetes bacterium]|nr:hypothetical protein [Bacteroidota bacterium]